MINGNELHPNNIPTTYKTLKQIMWQKGETAISSVLKSFSFEIGSNEFINQIIIAAVCFENISCLVYKDKSGNYKKPNSDYYAKQIFEAYAETQEEVAERICKYGINEKRAKEIFTMLWQISDLVCPMMSCIKEQCFVSEYAYAVEYIIKHKGNLPKPEISLIFPMNYKNYNYQDGIARMINKYGNI